MMPPLLWRWHRSGCVFILSVFGLCLGINVTCWSFQNFYAHGAVTTRRPCYQALQSSSSLHEDQLSGDGDSCGSQKGEFAKFTLSGSICGQKQEYLLDNINCSAGNEIKFCGPTSHQAVLKWTTPPRKVLLLSKPDRSILAALVDCLPYLAGNGLEIYVEESVYEELKELNSAKGKISDAINGAENFDRFSRRGEDKVFDGTKKSVNSIELKIFRKELPRSQGVDLVIAFGGDGLLMHCNTLFGGGSIPPSMCFDFGSLGFLAPFDYKDFEEEVGRVLRGPVMLTLRMRLHGVIFRDGETKGSFHILNEIVIDRGPSPFLAIIDLECDQQYLTTVQGDGIIVATPTGSTAYSLAAGGSMVHPSVPAILLTPICAHTLSFRPLLLPDSSVLICSIPVDCRSSGWVSFDGKFRQELLRGDRLEVKLSDHPMPTINRQNFTADWFDALRSGFMFNVRPRQKSY